MRRKARNDNAVDAPISATSFERLLNLVSLLLVKGEPQPEQIGTLVRAGYSNTEIARLLGMTPNAVNVAIHRLRRTR